MSVQTKSPARKSWREVLPIHPAAELFPRMTPDELKALGEDILKNGLTSSVALWRADPKGQAQLLDGLDAIELVTGKPVEIGAPSLMAGEFLACDKVIVLDGKTDPFTYIISANIQRRYLSGEQRRELIAKLVKADQAQLSGHLSATQLVDVLESRRVNTSIARLYAPYGPNMRFVSDPSPILKAPALKTSALTPVPRIAVALHEASHAVAARAYGLPVISATVGAATEIGAVGQVTYEKAGTAWEETVISLAGPGADVVFYNAHPIEEAATDFARAIFCTDAVFYNAHRIEGVGNDLAQRQYAREVDSQNSAEVMRQAWQAAVGIVRKNRTVIFCLAAVLECRDELSGAEIDGIIGSIKLGPPRLEHSTSQVKDHGEAESLARDVR